MLDWFAMISYVLITTFTPGPNNIMSMTNAIRFGLRRSMRFNLGVFTGLLFSYQRPFNMAMGLLLVYCAVSVFG